MIYGNCDQRSLRRFCLSALKKHWPNIARPLSRRTPDGIGGVFWKRLTTGASRSRLRRVLFYLQQSGLEPGRGQGEKSQKVYSPPKKGKRGNPPPKRGGNHA